MKRIAHGKSITYWLRAALAAILALFAVALAAAEQREVWPELRKNLFQDRAIQTPADDVIQLDLPLRADDAAIVPVAIRTGVAQAPDRYIAKLYLIVDRNPSPVGALFRFSPESGRAEIETRVRIEEYTNVRAIAEMNDGKLFMATRYIKASGGCSAPAGKDMAAALASLGKMRLRVESDSPAPDSPQVAQLMISHPNTSGLAMDQSTRLYPPAHFVRQIEVTYGGKRVMSAEIDFTISENPNFRFYFVPAGGGELYARAIDTSDLIFEQRIAVRGIRQSAAR